MDPKHHYSQAEAFHDGVSYPAPNLRGRLEAGSIVAVATKPVKQPNEDWGLPIHFRNGSGMVVCDGVGSSARSDVASAAAAQIISQMLVNARASDVTIETLREAFQRARQHLIEEEPDLGIEDASRPGCLATTMIAVVERTDDYLIGYVGNGTVYLIPGDVLSFVRHDRWPWGSTQLLVPHTSLSNTGTEILNRVLSPRCRLEDMRILTIEKDRELGEILIVTTDGVCSPDHQRTGRDASGRLWLQVDPRLETLIFKEFPQLPAVCLNQGEAARRALEELLGRFLSDGTWDDDATIGVLVSKTACDLLSNLRLAE